MRPPRFLSLILIFAILLFLTSVANFNKKVAETPSVEETSSKVVAACEKEAEKEECYKQNFKKLTSQYGSDYAFSVLFAIQQKREAQSCHPIAHSIGEALYETHKASWPNNLSSTTYLCEYGEVHGAVEAYKTAQKEKTLSPQTIASACGTNPSNDCIHFLGHIALVETRGDTKRALELCRASHNYSSCASGVFGEFSKPIHLIAHNYYPEAWLTDPKLLQENEKLCREQEGQDAESCWEEMAHAIVRNFSKPQEVFKFCNRAQSEFAAARCKTHAIGDFLRNNNFDHNSTNPLCSLAHNEPRFEEECYSSIAMQLLFRVPGELEREAEQAKSFCSGLEAEFQESCFQAVDYSLQKK